MAPFFLFSPIHSIRVQWLQSSNGQSKGEPVQVYLCCLILSLTLVGCRTTDNTPAAAESLGQEGSDQDRGSADQPDDFINDYRVDQEDSQDLYLKMITVEINAGLAVPKDKLHSAQGTIECRLQGVSRNCGLRVRLQDSRLSNSQQISSGLATTVKTYVADTREDLSVEKLQIVDVHCDYVGKQSPPYDVEDVGCTLRHPRSVNEVIFKGRSAQIVSEGLRTEQEFGSIKKQVSGTILCHWIETGGRNQCLVRPMLGSMLLERVVALNHSEGHVIGQQIRHSYLDQFALQSVPNAAVDSKADIPNEILGTVNCVVDSTKFDLTGRRDFSCRVVL